MTELQIALKIVLANTYLMGFKAQSYHWNVEGMFFPMFHDFFGDIYNELSTPVDDVAERIRTVYGYAPISIADLLTAATVMEDVARPVSVQMMLMSLEGCNQEVINSLNKAFTLAEQENNQGLMDVLAGRLDAHAKHAWMIRSTLKSIGA